MSDLWIWKWPILACLLLPPLLVYLGLHVVQREVIFVDLALAQVAALGTCIAVFLGRFMKEKVDFHDAFAFWISLGVTFIGAALFSWSRSVKKRHVPQEAIIGITFAVAAAGVIVLLDKIEGGKDELDHLLTGEILTITGPPDLISGWLFSGAWWFDALNSDLGLRLVLFAVLGGFYCVFHKRFALISSQPDEAYAQGLHVRLWDFLFYAAFGLVVVSFVRVAGVLLTFAYLIVPAVCGTMLAKRWVSKLTVGCGTAAIATSLGILASNKFDLPMGAAIVCACGLLLAVVSVIAAIRNR